MGGIDSSAAAVCSVVIPTFNRAGWLPACIESVRRSGTAGLEIVVVDDGSTDNTPDVLARFGPDIHYYYQPHAGPSRARNNGIRASRGRYLAFLDSDDRWLPGAHQSLIEFLDRHPEVDVGFADFMVGTGQSDYQRFFTRPERETFWQLPCREAAGGFRVLERRSFFRCLALSLQPICIDAVVVRRSALERAGGFDEQLMVAEDWELWLRLAAEHTFAYHHRPAAVYEKHADSLSSDRVAMQAAFVEVPRRVLAKVPTLTSDDRRWLKARFEAEAYGWVYTAFDRLDRAETRRRCAEWIKVCGPRPRAVLYWCTSWLRSTELRRLRAVKRWLRRDAAGARG